MPSLPTEITEIATALGMLGMSTIEEALDIGPSIVKNVTDEQWQRLVAAHESGEYDADFVEAWDNGRAFFFAPEGLRTRVPLIVEWKGGQNPPGFDFLPADLRIDHVFLVSCKYRKSKVLANSSPSNLFVRLLADRTAGQDDWYHSAAPEAYRTFYEAVREHLRPIIELPQGPDGLKATDIEAIRAECGRAWPDSLAGPWREFSMAVAERSASIWSERLPNLRRREDMLWRLLRLNPAPYFLLGTSGSGSLRVRVGTPWDWRQSFELRSFEIEPLERGQPTVRWCATVRDKVSHLDRSVAGHVEVRWSHGRYSGVEAKVYLDTPHADVPGYFPIR